MTEVDHPYRLEGGGTASTTYEDHVRDLVEQLLLTSPGERVNRPDFGSGLLQLVFAPAGPEVAAALQFAIEAAVQRWLGEVVELRGLDVDSEDGALKITVQYALRATGEVRTETFAPGGSS